MRHPFETESKYRTERARMSSLKALGASAICVLSVLGIQNRENIQAIWEYMHYEEPADNDIIPEELGECSVEKRTTTEQTSDIYQAFSVANTDVIRQKVGKAVSRSRSYGSATTQQFTHSEKLFFPFNNYLSEKTGEFSTAFGITLEVWRNPEDEDFVILRDALDELLRAPFKDLTIYQDPTVREIMTCFERNIEVGGELDGQVFSLGVIPSECLSGNNVVTLSGNQTAGYCHSIGFGPPPIDFRAGPYHLIKEDILIVTGGSKDYDQAERRLSQRSLHEFLHKLLFRDLSNTAKEVTEQERFVKYVEDSVVQSYESRGLDLPVFIKIQK